jgi:hypothetical protein
VDHQLEAVFRCTLGEQLADRVPLAPTAVAYEAGKHVRPHAPAVGPLDQRLGGTEADSATVPQS